ncbi:hypothetical protein MASR2M18_09810 [Ignavibacteria bacterium]
MRFGRIAGIIIGVLLLLSGVSLSAQTTDSVVRRQPPSAYEGRHFFVGFIQNEDYILQGGLHLQIFIASSSPTRVGIVPPGSRIVNYFYVPKDTVITLEVAQSELGNYESTESEYVRYKLAEIISDQPVTVYAMSSQAQTSDAYSVLPVTEWDRDYVVLSMPNDKYTDDPEESEEMTSNRQSEILIMAAYDNTLVVITPSTRTERGYKRGETFSITLNKGQCYLIKSDRSLPSGDGDLSGTIISADKPIGMLAGHVRASVPPLQYHRGEDNSKDHLCDMLLPVQKWDSEYVSIPFDILSPQGDYFKITAAYPNTEVMYSGPGISGLFKLDNPGDTATLDGVNIPLLWTANKKFSIAQFMETSFNRGELFDPAMVILPPRNRYVSRALFQVLPNPPYNPQKFRYHYVGLVVDALALRNVMLDGVRVADLSPNILTQIIPLRNLYWVNLNVLPGKHELRTDYGKFSGVIYGVGMNDSYAMTLGISFDRPDEDTLPPTVNYSDDCGVFNGEATDKLDAKMSGIFSVTVIQNSNFGYKISQLTDTSKFSTFTAKPIDPTKDGLIVFDIRDKSGNGRIVRHVYNAIKISVEKEISYGAVNWLDSTCKKIVIRNTGGGAVLLNGVVLSGDKRVKFVPDISDALKNRSLAAGDSVELNICFYPSLDSSALDAVCSINLPCDLTLDIPVIAQVVAPGLVAEGWDFGDVLIGDTVCAFVKVRNTGNVPMIISQLLISPPPDFIFKTEAVLPDTLAPRDSLLVPVCFAPSTRTDYKEGGFAVDQFNGRVGFIVTGRGVAPLVFPIAIDWGKRRVGAAYDSLFWIKNNGNMSATISYESIAGDAAAFATTSSGVQSFDIKADDSIQVLASFVPPANGTRTFKATETFRIINWRLHQPIGATLTGEGTLPAVITYDTDFGIVQTNKSKDSLTLCLFADGNEDLAVDSMYIISGDSDSFIISAAELRRKRTLAPGSNIYLQATFAPKRVGKHEITFSVIHDAAPNYKREESTFKFTGNATPDDTLRGEMSLLPSITGAVPACVRNPIIVTVKNTGNRTLIVDSLYATVPQQAKIIESSLPALPYNLPRDEEISASFIVKAEGNTPFDVSFRATATAGIVLEKTLTINPALNNVTAEIRFDDLPAMPGKTGNIMISGTIKAADTMQILPLLSFTLPSKMAVLSGEGAICRFTEGDTAKSVAITTVQSETKVEIKFPAPVIISSNADWKITLPYMLMLSEQLIAPVELTFRDSSGKCFGEASGRTVLDVSPVCAQLIRTVKAMSGVYLLLGVSPQPAGEAARIRYIAPEPMEAEFEAVNLLGVATYLGKTELGSGTGEIMLDVSMLPPGVYRLSGRSKSYGTRNVEMLIISR